MRNTSLRSSPVGQVAVEEAASVAASVAVVRKETTVESFPNPPTLDDSRQEADDSVFPPPDAVTISLPHVFLVSEPGYPRSSITVEASPLTWTRLQPGDHRHPCRLTDIVRVSHYISRIDRIRTRFTNPTSCRVGMALPDAATVNHVPNWSLRGHTVQVSPQLTTAMSRYKLIPNQS